METQIDVLIIGGGAAGSGAALQLGRTRRSVVVIDSGQPRNAPAAHMHGYLGFDGMAPVDFLAKAHAELGAYGVTVRSDRVAQVSEVGDQMRCVLASGDVYLARRIVLATGLTDVMPEIEGVTELWGDQVIHCPWCHGWEVRDDAITVVDTAGMGTHQALMFAHLSSNVSLIRNDVPQLSPEDEDRLRLAKVNIIAGKAVTFTKETEGLVIGLETEDSPESENDVVHQTDFAVIGPRFEPNTAPVEAFVQVSDHASGMGRVVVVDETGRTSHPNIYAAGNVCDPMQQVLHAAADGTKVAAMLHGGPGGLIDDDLDRARKADLDQAEWDSRYWDNGNNMWSGQPNGSIVVEAKNLTPGRVLDLGCGEGADAIWFARRGWEATGTDISEVAVDRARSAAKDLEVTAHFDVVDVLLDPPAAGSYDLVAISYPALKRDRSLHALRHITEAVARGGRLLVVGHAHDAEALERAAEHGFDPSEYVSIDDIIATLGSDFELEVNDQRDRPNPPVDNHHQRDRVLVARRVSH